MSTPRIYDALGIKKVQSTSISLYPLSSCYGSVSLTGLNPFNKTNYLT